MTNEIAPQQKVQQGEIILYQPDETVRLNVRIENVRKVWLYGKCFISLQAEKGHFGCVPV